MALSVERIGNYKVVDMGNGQYAVSVTNGNMGAFVTDEKGLLEFKKKHNLDTDTVEFSNKKILDRAGKIDPRKDKVFYNPRTGEFDTWKPGIYDPEKQAENKSKIGKLIGGLLGVTTVGLGALIFKKPLGGLIAKASGAIKTVGKVVLENAQGLIGKVIKFFGKKTV